MDRDIWFGNSLREIAIASGTALALLALVWLIRFVACRRLKNATATASPIDDFLLDLAQRTKLLLLVLPAAQIAARMLSIPQEIAGLLAKGAVLSLLVQVALWATGLVDFWLRRYTRMRAESDPSSVMTLGAFRMAGVAAIWIVAVILAIDNLGFNVGALIAGLGIGGVAVALATQNILGDLFASLSIVVDKPFIIGDVIMVDTHIGTVEHIGMKTTRIRSLNGEQLVFSNGDLLQSRIRNFKRMTERRIVSRLGVVYSTPPELLEKIPMMIRAAIEKHEKTRVDRVHFASLGQSAFEFEYVYYLEDPEYAFHMGVQQAVNLDLVRGFAAEGIEFAFPTQTVYVRQEDGGDSRPSSGRRPPSPH